MSTTLEILKKSLLEKTSLINSKENQLNSEKNNAEIINRALVKSRVDAEGSNSICSQEQKNKGYNFWIFKRSEVPSNELALMDKSWTEMKMCNELSSKTYKKAKDDIFIWENKKSNLISEINTLKKEASELEEKIKGYSNTIGGKKELEINKIIEKGKEDVAKAKAEAELAQAKLNAIQAERQNKNEKEKKSNKKIIIIILIIILILALGGGIFWYIKKRKAGKK